MELIGFSLFLFFVALFLAATVISALFIWIGTKIAGVSGATFGKAFWAAILTSFTVWALTGIASVAFGFGSVAGWMLGVVITLAILKWIYKTTWGKSFLTWLFCGLAQVVVLVVAIVLALTGAIVGFGIL
jgi:hypothetical protein